MDVGEGVIIKSDKCMNAGMKHAESEKGQMEGR